MSPLEKLSVEIYFTFCSVFYLAPWEWYNRKGVCKISVTKSKWKKRCWVFNGVMNSFTVAGMCFALYHFTNASIGLTVLAIIILVANAVSTLMYIIQALKGYEELASIIQACVDLDEQFQKHFKGCIQPKKLKIDIVGLGLCMFVPGMMFMAFCMACYMSLLKEESVISYIDFPSRSLEVRMLVTLLRFCVVYYLNIIFLAPMALYVMSAAIFVKMANHWTGTMLMQPDIKPALMRRYTEFKIIDDIINRHMHWAAPMLIAMAFVVHVIVNFAILRLKDAIGMPGYLMYPALGLILTGGEIMNLPIAAKMHTKSEEFLWQCQNHKNTFNRKFGKAFKTIHIALGNYGLIDLGFVVTYYSALIDNTINVLMSIEE